jgi:hypothetical protein
MTKRSKKPTRTAVRKSAALSVRIRDDSKKMLVDYAKRQGESVSSTLERFIQETMNPNDALDCELSAFSRLPSPEREEKTAEHLLKTKEMTEYQQAIRPKMTRWPASRNQEILDSLTRLLEDYRITLNTSQRHDCAVEAIVHRTMAKFYETKLG